jgi:hypothetical protein
VFVRMTSLMRRDAQLLGTNICLRIRRVFMFAVLLGLSTAEFTLCSSVNFSFTQ